MLDVLGWCWDDVAVVVLAGLLFCRLCCLGFVRNLHKVTKQKFLVSNKNMGLCLCMQLILTTINFHVTINFLLMGLIFIHYNVHLCISCFVINASLTCCNPSLYLVKLFAINPPFYLSRLFIRGRPWEVQSLYCIPLLVIGGLQVSG